MKSVRVATSGLTGVSQACNKHYNVKKTMRKSSETCHTTKGWLKEKERDAEAARPRWVKVGAALALPEQISRLQ